MRDLILTSSAFSDGGEIPRECGYKNENTHPPLQIRGIPDEAVELALIMDDPDAMGAVGKVWVHWVVWNIQPHKNDHATGFTHDEIESLSDHTNDDMTYVKTGMTDFGETDYGGPAPPDKRHTYVFKLYALDTKLDLPDKSTKADVEKAMEGYILEETTLTGTYAP